MATSVPVLDPAAVPQTPPPPPTPQAVPEPASQAPPEPTFDDLFAAQPQWFLEAPTGTRYRTAEEAARGVAEKDVLIQQLRQQLQQTAPQAQAPAWRPQAPTMADVLNHALTTGHPEMFDAFMDARTEQRAAQIAQRVLEAQLAPIQPLIGHSNMAWAVEQAAQLDPNIPAFVRSEAFRQVAQKFDIVRDAIQQARDNPGMYMGQLPKILHLAYTLAGSLAPAAVPGRATPGNSSTPPQAVGRPPQGGTALNVRDLPLDQVLRGEI